VPFDWFTVAAQVVNFLILVALLKRFLYRPILDAVAERERSVADRFHAAEEREHQAQEEGEAYRARQRELEERRDEMLSAARADADRLAKELREQARAEAEEQRRRWHEAVSREADAFLHELRSQVARAGCEVARRAVTELADADLEGRIIEAFLRKLRAAPEGERAKLRSALAERAGGGDGLAVVRTAHELSEAQESTIAEALRAELGADLGVAFEPTPELLCGILVEANGYRIGWELGKYLDDVNERVAGLLEKRSDGTRAGSVSDGTR
jgi:F-type H+-transporting ATPase subunit b